MKCVKQLFSVVPKLIELWCDTCEEKIWDDPHIQAGFLSWCIIHAATSKMKLKRKGLVSSNVCIWQRLSKELKRKLVFRGSVLNRRNRRRNPQSTFMCFSHTWAQLEDARCPKAYQKTAYVILISEKYWPGWLWM